MQTGLQARSWHATYDSDGHTTPKNVRMSPTGTVDGTRPNEGLCSIIVYGVCSFLSSKIVIRRFYLYVSRYSTTLS
jgi:hypothetical protein